MATFETFTAEEIISILRNLEITTDHISAIDDEDEMETLVCELGEINFFGFLLPQEPFFEEISLRAVTWVYENPYEFVNQFNSEKRASTAFVVVNDDGLLKRDEEGQCLVITRLPLSFVGGVTKAHLEFMLSIWIEDLFDFFQIESEVDESEEQILLNTPNDLSEIGTSLVERISVFLELNGERAARDIARALKVDKQKVNRILYRNLKTFLKSSSQPPMWSIRSK